MKSAAAWPARGAALLLSVCLYSEDRADPLTPVADRPGLPRVLLIGDSIAIGYTLAVRQLLPEANVHRPPENCRSTRQTLARIETYLGAEKWDVIHFNCGIHDLTFVGPSGRGLLEKDGGMLQVPLAEYRRNLEEIITRLQKTGAVLIFATTTPVSESAPFRRPADILAYNAAALEIMQKRGIAVNDLCTEARRALSGKSIDWKDGVHFSPVGYDCLAQQVARAVRQALVHSASTAR